MNQLLYNLCVCVGGESMKIILANENGKKYKLFLLYCIETDKLNWFEYIQKNTFSTKNPFVMVRFSFHICIHKLRMPLGSYLVFGEAAVNRLKRP